MMSNQVMGKQPVQPQPQRSKNIALTDFIKPSDDVVLVIGMILKEHLNAKLAENESLEIEAKIGLIEYSRDLGKGDPFNSIFSTPHGLILPEQRWNGKNLYYFKPGIPKESFDLLIEIFRKESEKRLADAPEGDERQRAMYMQEYCIKDLGEVRTIDRVFSDGVRSTYSHNNELIENLKKSKLKNINYFNKGKAYRISVAIEQKCGGPTVQKITTTRHKRRHSFQFKWLKFEFTETMEENFKGEKSEPVYEVEAEICDNKFFNQPNFDIYMRLVERFTQNIETLITAVHEGNELFYDSYCKPEFEKAYQEQYEGNIMPVVGDYLATKAYTDKAI